MLLLPTKKLSGVNQPISTERKMDGLNQVVFRTLNFEMFPISVLLKFLWGRGVVDREGVAVKYG